MVAGIFNLRPFTIEKDSGIMLLKVFVCYLARSRHSMAVILLGGVEVVSRRVKRKAKGRVPEDQILDTFIQAYYDLGLMTYDFVKEILVGRSVPPRGLIDLLGITSSEVRQNIKQKLELLNNQKDQDPTELRELLSALRTSMEIVKDDDE